MNINEIRGFLTGIILALYALQQLSPREKVCESPWHSSPKRTVLAVLQAVFFGVLVGTLICR